MENLVVSSVFFGALLFFFPFFVQLCVVYQNGKPAFSVYLFSWIRLAGGYVTFDQKAYTVHLSAKKAVYVPYAKMKEEGKKFQITQGIQPYSLRFVAEMNASSDASLCFFALVQPLLRAAAAAYARDKRFLSLKSGLLLSDQKGGFALESVFVFNFFVLARAFTKIIAGRIVTKWQKRQKQPIKS